MCPIIFCLFARDFCTIYSVTVFGSPGVDAIYLDWADIFTRRWQHRPAFKNRPYTYLMNSLFLKALNELYSGHYRRSSKAFNILSYTFSITQDR
ncbi:uncharacterized protein ANIA_11427 [Aspergillus nidulans FGSC A4]|uniref:Uncharacterized protein n=1 Tax=Emericella nidulans (strain FGSC A4 / ATCC 38163 / CBS 112.46 / NRRL 194 / M139) TaxID=227321 RepID=C8V515_EMENI|nr:hypothetical protein [Aspergillus nidulans FGSC A4]CBF74665.1 TPA: hypothetical protein ANIA_11427 [Aspergillus nidulans FGSC A4]